MKANSLALKPAAEGSFLARCYQAALTKIAKRPRGSNPLDLPPGHTLADVAIELNPAAEKPMGFLEQLAAAPPSTQAAVSAVMGFPASALPRPSASEPPPSAKTIVPIQTSAPKVASPPAGGDAVHRLETHPGFIRARAAVDSSRAALDRETHPARRYEQQVALDAAEKHAAELSFISPREAAEFLSAAVGNSERFHLARRAAAMV